MSQASDDGAVEVSGGMRGSTKLTVEQIEAQIAQERKAAEKSMWDDEDEDGNYWRQQAERRRGSTPRASVTERPDSALHQQSTQQRGTTPSAEQVPRVSQDAVHEVKQSEEERRERILREEQETRLCKEEEQVLGPRPRSIDRPALARVGCGY